MPAAAPTPRPGDTHLRARPRQRRSAERVEAILDAAADVFEEVGYDAATTNLVAARAGVPIPTLYRWFPDKAAIALALCERYLDDIEQVYRELLSVGDDEPIRVLVRRVLEGLEQFVGERRALPAIAAMASGPQAVGGAGDRLREALAGHVALLVELRVPGVDPGARDEVTDAIVTVVNAFLTRAGDVSRAEHPRLFRQLGDIVLAYVEAKFPNEDSPVWDDPDRAVEPFLPGVRVPWPDRDDAGPSPEP